jgi:hypothetical protein
VAGQTEVLLFNSLNIVTLDATDEELWEVRAVEGN